MSQVNMIDELANFIFVSKYARYNEKEQRRETWEEAICRVEEMHLKKFTNLSEEQKKEIRWAFELVKSKKVVPSMRSMQFGGKAIESKNERMFNCCVRHIDSLRAFAEIFYLLLCGTGTGIGLSNHFLSRIPDLVDPNDRTGSVLTYAVEDTIEGWADSLQVLMNCYFKNTGYSGRKIVFDYSKIRRKGAKLKTGGGKAPGYKPLKNAHVKIKELLDLIIEERGQTRLKSIDAYDILMHASDAVLSGGVRRSASCVVFEKTDEDMLNAKTGKWYEENPQRGRSNNSILLMRDEVSKEEFEKIVERTKQWGEPGFLFADHKWTLFNPCQNASATILTKNGIRTFNDLKINDEIWSETGWTKIINKWSTGVKRVYKYETAAGVFYGTENHRIVQNGKKIEVKDAESIDVLSGNFDTNIQISPKDIIDGLVIGDGTKHDANNGLVLLHIGKNDWDYFDSEIKDLIIKRYYPDEEKTEYVINTTITSSEMKKTFLREIPDRFFYGNKSSVCGFLRGLFSANGSICGGRITLKTSSKKMREQVQIMLSSIGIVSYFTTNKPSMVKFSNGDFLCKESYDINITSDRRKFSQLIGFIQNYKNEALDTVIKQTKPSNRHKTSYEIRNIEFLCEEEVFDLTVDNAPHTYWTGGINVSNCFEVSFLPVTEDGVCGVQVCNLTSINGAKTKTKEEFKDCVKAATLIGTLQASYTKFPYLAKVSEQLTNEEALLGVSITGIMDSPDILLDKSNQKEMAKYAVEVNKEWAKIIGVNQAARITLLKPEGTSSLALGCSSGIHPHHAHKYLRRVQMNKEEPTFKFFKKRNPHMCEPSVWSSNKTDEVVTFPISVPQKSITKDQISAIEHLEIIKNTQQNWVLNGATEVNKKPLNHNVSCTVVVKDEEWADVIDYIYKNRKYFTAVSLLGASGEKDYKQSPLERVSSDEEKKKFNDLFEKYKPVDYTELKELHDDTELQQVIACGGGQCEIL